MTLLETFEAYLNVLPGFQAAFIGHNDDSILEILSKQIADVDGTVKAFIYDQQPLEVSHLELKMMDDYTKSFRTIAREYELLILNDILQAPLNLDRLMKNAFKALENSGNLLVVAPRADGISEQLEKYGFVAINEIETDDNDRVLISAKKMHGWGHGL